MSSLDSMEVRKTRVVPPENYTAQDIIHNSEDTVCSVRGEICISDSLERLLGTSASYLTAIAVRHILRTVANCTTGSVI